MAEAGRAAPFHYNRASEWAFRAVRFGSVLVLLGVAVGLSFEAAKGRQGPSNDSLSELDKQLKALTGQLDNLAAATTQAKTDAKADVEGKLAELRTLVTKIGSETKDGAKAHALAEKVSTDLANLQTKVNSLQPAQFGEALSKFEKELGDLRKKMEGDVKALEAKIGNLKGPGKETGQSTVEPTDVLVVVMHSNNLSLHNHLPAIVDLVHPDRRAVPEGCRVGLLLLEGSDPDLLFPLKPASPEERKSAEKRLGQLRGASKDTTDRLEEAIGPVRDAFRDSREFAHRRCVIIASANCLPPPLDKLGEWKDVAVQIILVGSDSRVRDQEKKLLDWYRFGRACRGSVTLLGAEKNPETADETLTAQLQALLIQATQPVHRLTLKR
jgi:uncharacterized protein YukE